MCKKCFYLEALIFVLITCYDTALYLSYLSSVLITWVYGVRITIFIILDIKIPQSLSIFADHIPYLGTGWWHGNVMRTKSHYCCLWMFSICWYKLLDFHRDITPSSIIGAILEFQQFFKWQHALWIKSTLAQTRSSVLMIIKIWRVLP